jgi:uncharacterized protein (TIGR03435 family)
MTLGVAILTFGCVALGQRFDVASIKPANPDPHAMFGIRHMPGGGISAAGVTLKLLIENAYGVQDFQIAGGPGWLETARYNIEAKPDSPAGPNEWRGMLQNLLVDRFRLAVHRETKELPVYALVLARKDGKLGTGMVEAKEGGCAVRDPSKPIGEAGPGQLPWCGNVLGALSQLTGTAATIGDMAGMLSLYVGRKVIDHTGLTGKYDFTLSFTPDARPPSAPADGPTLFAALQEEFGLKLEAQKGPVEILVIERAEKPSEN